MRQVTKLDKTSSNHVYVKMLVKNTTFKSHSFPTRKKYACWNILKKQLFLFKLCFNKFLVRKQTRNDKQICFFSHSKYIIFFSFISMIVIPTTSLLPVSIPSSLFPSHMQQGPQLCLSLEPLISYSTSILCVHIWFINTHLYFNYICIKTTCTHQNYWSNRRGLKGQMVAVGWRDKG